MTGILYSCYDCKQDSQRDKSYNGCTQRDKSYNRKREQKIYDNLEKMNHIYIYRINFGNLFDKHPLAQLDAVF